MHWPVKICTKRDISEVHHQSQVSIFIPTHNRIQILNRNLSWLRDSGYPIVIADSSNQNNLAKIEEHKAYCAERLTYLYSNNQNYFEKIVGGLNCVETPYVVMCPDDDFILWQNIKYLYATAIKNNAGTVCGRDLRYIRSNNAYTFKEVSRYRKFCIKKHESILDHLSSGMNPIVCTFYQFYKTETLKEIFSFMNHNKQYTPGNKFMEILFRSATFINGPVYFCDKVFRIIGVEPPLRSYDQSTGAQEYKLNFWDEYHVMKKNNLLNPFINSLSGYILKHIPLIDQGSANEIAINKILNPMFLRMHVKHEMLWDQPYTLSFSTATAIDEIVNRGNTLDIRLALKSIVFKKPEILSSLDDFLIGDQEQWLYLREFVKYLSSNS
jgi:glycosyltransferase domain-containing protein